MPIDFSCTCGKTLKAPDTAAGRKARCPRCQSIVTVPSAVSAASMEYDLQEPAPRPITLISQSKIESQKPKIPAPSLTTNPALREKKIHTFQRFAYLLFLLALIPLILSTFQPHQKTADKFDRTIKAHPEILPALSQLIDADGTLKGTKKELFTALPNDRLDGALLPYDTHAHYLIALATAAAFFSFLLLAFPYALRHAKGLLLAGLFTGTIGVLLLIAFQWAAFSLPWFTPHGAYSLVIDVIKLIGLSYSLADGDTGFLLSFLGFTCGVGLCEEITKALPLLYRIKPIPGEEDPTWNGMLLWGLASGVGFGIAEGIMYSGRYYNGVESANIYYVRFLSCVALHAMWAGANGIAIYRRQSDLLDADNNWVYFGRLILIVLVPMILHGLYDTLLKQDHDAVALLIAALTFAWLMFQIERLHRTESPALTAA
jgi:RsiW-degrading membrane proteinase PrsW (M82 family)